MKRVVIVGGGLAGHRIAYALQKDAEVTLIDPKDYFEVPMAAPRMLVEPRRAADAIIPFADFLPNVQHIQGRVSGVEPAAVLVAGRRVPFEYLVLATGCAYRDELVKPHAGSVPARREHFHQWADRIRTARRILIVGGGPVGVEVAGEILEEQPGKDLTLIHSGSELLPGLTPRPQKYALSFLRERGAKVMLNRSATDGDIAEADIAFYCAGYRADTSYLRDFPGPVLNPAGLVLTDSNLRMAGTDNIFVAGDITALPETKLGIRAGKHAGAITANIRALIRANAGSRVKLTEYKPATGDRTMLVTLGRNHGTGHIPLGDFTNSWFARTVKARDMFIGRYRKALGLS